MEKFIAFIEYLFLVKERKEIFKMSQQTDALTTVANQLLAAEQQNALDLQNLSTAYTALVAAKNNGEDISVQLATLGQVVTGLTTTNTAAETLLAPVAAPAPAPAPDTTTPQQ